MELFCLAQCSTFKFTSKKKPNWLLQRKKLSEEIANYDDTNELKDEKRNDKLYLIEIAVIALNRTIFRS
jgi:uncharacterized membrane protein YbaN (DUF454 family)